MVHVVISKPAKHASTDYIWSKLAEYSDMSWHPEIKMSENKGNIADGSAIMVGAVRLLTKNDGHELLETVTEWDERKKYFALSIDKGAPPFAKELHAAFHVREEGELVFVDFIIDAKLKKPFFFLSPLVAFVLPKKLGGFAQGVADLKE